jgi:hypothetical protein
MTWAEAEEIPCNATNERAFSIYNFNLASNNHDRPRRKGLAQTSDFTKDAPAF